MSNPARFSNVIPSSAEAVSKALASILQVDAQRFQEIVGSVVCTASSEPHVGSSGGESVEKAAGAQALYDADSRTLVLQVDRIPAGHETAVLIRQLATHLGPDVVSEILGADHVASKTLSDEFLSGVSRLVGEKGILEIGWRNLLEPHSDVCHSHDVCDANEVMLQAFERVFHRAASLNDAHDSRFIDVAWAMAKVVFADSVRNQAFSDLPLTPNDFRESLHVSARPVFSQADGGFVIPGHPDLGSFPRSDDDALHALATSRGIQLAEDAGASFARRPLEGGDKVFVRTEQRLATVLNVYGDGVNGSYGDVRLDLCGNTSIADLEHYDSAKHAAFDHTFVPIRAEWKRTYGITKDVPLLEDVVLLQLRGALESATRLGLFDDLAAHVHPDVINDFCDAVDKLELQGPAPAIREYVPAPDMF